MVADFYLDEISITEVPCCDLELSATSSCDATGGSIDLTVTGGSLNYLYNWTGTNGFSASTQDLSGLSDGTYCVTVYDDADTSCTVDTCITISCPSSIICDPAPGILSPSTSGFENFTYPYWSDWYFSHGSPSGGPTPYMGNTSAFMWSASLFGVTLSEGMFTCFDFDR